MNSIHDVARAIRQRGHQNLKTTGSLEFEYSTAARSVTMTALSVGDRGTLVFRVPMWDVYAQKSATGGYPWRIEGGSSTIAYIKNAEAHYRVRGSDAVCFALFAKSFASFAVRLERAII